MITYTLGRARGFRFAVSPARDEGGLVLRAARERDDAVNIGEIARQAGVSRSTVSYVLSGKRQIGASTRERVMAIVDQSGFRPSAAARALAHGVTRTLALVVPPLHHHLNIEILQFVGAIAEVAADQDYDTLLSPTGGEREDAFQRLVGERRVDGVLLMETRIPDLRAKALLDLNFPFVTIGRAGFDDQHDWVDTDYAGLVTEAVERLAAKGHRHLALINRPKDLADEGYSLTIIARNAFEAACEAAGVQGMNAWCDEEDAAAAKCLDEVFAVDPEVTGLISVNDRALVGLMDTLRARRLAVPQDMSVLAVAADRIADRTDPRVTAADIPVRPLAELAVAALLGRVGNLSPAPIRKLIKPPFTDRGSVSTPPADRSL